LDPRSARQFAFHAEWLGIGSEQVNREENGMASIEVEAARIPDRDRMVELLRGHGIDAQPHDEVGIAVNCAGDNGYDEVYEEVESLIFDLGATMVPQKHEGVIYIRPPVS
jgi:hypothetical protein